MIVPTKISGTVKRGEGIGAKKLVPTINLDPKLLAGKLAFGVYRCRLRIFRAWYPGVLHFGPKKTLRKPVSLEVHLIGFSGQIKGKIEVEIYEKIRDVKAFTSLSSLKRQIEKDIIIASESSLDVP